MGFKHTELSSQNGYCKTTCTHVAYLWTRLTYSACHVHLCVST
jgi:hypothetical protein